MSNRVKVIGLGLITILLILTLVVLNPAFQKFILSYAAEKIEAKTGWQISAKGVRIFPWQDINIERLMIAYHNRQFFIGNRIAISTSLTLKKPYIKLKKILLYRPTIVIERDAAGKISFPPFLRTPENQKNKQSDFKKILAILPEVIIHHGTLTILKKEKIDILVKDMNIHLKPASDGIRIDNSSAFMERPFIGTVSLDGIGKFKKGTIKIEDFSISSSSIFSTLDGQINFGTPRGFISGNIYMTNPHFLSLTLLPGINIGYSRTSFKMEIKPTAIYGRLYTKHKKFGEVDSSFYIPLPINKEIRGTLKSHLNLITAKVSTRGRLNIKGFWQSNKNFYAIIKGDFKKADFRGHDINRLLIKTSISPHGLDISKFIVKAGSTLTSIKLAVKSGNTLEFDRNISLSGRWNFTTAVSGESLSTIGKIEAICAENCTKKVDPWDISLKAQATYGSSSIIAMGKLKHGNISGSTKINRMPLEFLGNLVKSSQHLKGSLNSFIQFKGNLFYPQVKTQGNIKAVRFKNWQADNINFTFNGIVKGKDSTGTVKVSFQGLKIPKTDETVKAKFIARKKNNKLNFSLEGNSNRKHYIYCKGIISNLWKNPSVVLEKTVIKWNEVGKYRASAQFGISPNKLAIDYLNIYHSKGWINVKGILSKNRTSRLGISLSNFPVNSFLKLSRINIDGGRINGKITIDTMGEVLGGNARIEIDDGSISSSDTSNVFSWQKISFHAIAQENRLSVQSVIKSPSFNKPCNIAFAIPVGIKIHWGHNKYIPKVRLVTSKTQPISGKLDIADSKLNILQPFLPAGYRLAGLISARINVNGTFEEYHINGNGRVKNVSIAFPDKSYNFSNINGNFLIKKSAVQIKLSGKGFKGDFSISGKMPIIPSINNVKLTITLNKITPPLFYGIEGTVSGVGTIAGYENGLVIKGKLKPLKASLDLDKLNREIKKNMSEIEFVEGNKSSVITTKEEKSDFFKNRIEMHIQIDFSNAKAWVHGMGINSEVAGNLIVEKKLGKPLQLFGEIKSKRGWYTFQSIRLKITKGMVRFRGLTPPDPELRVTCEKKVRDVTVLVHLSGSIEEPVLKLASTPPMSNVDILSYLLFNRPARQLTTRESVGLQEQAALFLGSKATKVLKDILGKTPFSPDILDFRQESSGSEILEIGKYITPDFYVTYEKDVKDDRNDQVSIEYIINKHFSIQSQLGGENQSGIDILWRYDFGD